ncbi:MAG: CDP-alcohol phosphatidyltransferase family protein [Lachnospiraceae bacterium]
MANFITSIRIICSIALICCPALSIPFYVIYAIAGISDMLDGAVARKTDNVSEPGGAFYQNRTK